MMREDDERREEGERFEERETRQRISLTKSRQ
jgi:hypothetical protein